jgi:hypothetical protein
MSRKKKMLTLEKRHWASVMVACGIIGAFIGNIIPTKETSHANAKDTSKSKQILRLQHAK